MMPQDYQQMQDDEHLRLLSIFHYIFGGLCFLGTLFGLFYIGMGTLFSGILKEAGTKGPGSPPVPEFGMIFAVIGTVVMVISATLGTGHILSARWIKQRRHRTFSMVVAGISCLSFPFGTAVGVFTLIVLARPSVARLFDANLTTTPHA